MAQMYELKYLPIALKDLEDIAEYITHTFKTPDSAINFLNSIEKSILQIQQFPYSNRIYQPIRILENEYRLLPVKNYVVLYIVKEKQVEIHRIIYAKRDITNIIAP